jgi:2-aminoadipate transaminase
MDELLSYRGRHAGSSAIRDLLRLTEQPDVLSLAGGLPAADAFPVERLRQATERVLGAGGLYGPRALQYGPTEGVDELRELVGRNLGVPAATTIITTGSQQALDLIAKVLVDRDDPVVVEVPAYIGALQAIGGQFPNFIPVRSDAEGLDTDHLGELLRNGLKPKLVYTVTNFQNPTGATMSLARRAELGALAEQYRFVVVDDDPYGALRFRGEPLPPIRQFTSMAVSLGTTSKVLAPGLRVGWMAVPEWLVGPVVRAKQGADLHTSTFAQFVALDALNDGPFLAAHLVALAEVYRARCQALLRALDGLVELHEPDGGMFLWGRIPGVNSADLLKQAVECGVAFVPGSAFCIDGSGSDSVRLSYATLNESALAEAAARLHRAVHFISA